MVLIEKPAEGVASVSKDRPDGRRVAFDPARLKQKSKLGSAPSSSRFLFKGVGK
jgi:hypothetical protein